MIQSRRSMILRDQRQEHLNAGTLKQCKRATRVKEAQEPAAKRIVRRDKMAEPVSAQGAIATPEAICKWPSRILVDALQQHLASSGPVLWGILRLLRPRQEGAEEGASGNFGFILYECRTTA